MPVQAAPPGTECPCSVRHDPDPCGRFEYHHVLPLGLSGEQNGRRIYLCGTGHNTTHAMIAAMVRVPRGAPLPGRYTVLPGHRPSRVLYDLAVEAHRLRESAGRPTPRIMPEEELT